jgi:hypothetical protein
LGEKEFLLPSLSEPFDWKLNGPEKSLPEREFCWDEVSDEKLSADNVGEFVDLRILRGFICLNSEFLSKDILSEEVLFELELP